MRAGAAFARGLCFGLLALLLPPQQAAAADAAVQAPVKPEPVKTLRADFARQWASVEARHVANWVVHSGDNRAGDSQAGDDGRLPFAIVDKKQARVFVFHPDGKLRGAAPALLGSARGDEDLPGIGDRELRHIAPKDRTTPAGRFVASLGHDAHGVDILTIDYDANIAMHRVINTDPKQRRLHRLATKTPADNRISYGCINIPVKFYEKVVLPAFTGTKGIVYVLPDTRPVSKIFASYYDVEERVKRERSEVKQLSKEAIQ